MVADPETASVPPPSLAEYRKIQELASGGMGSVELARALSGPRGGQIVAVKRLHPHLEREKHFADMFFDEAWITAGLHHPNVVEIFDWGMDSNGRYLALEFVPGDSLLALIRDAKKQNVQIPMDIALYILGKTAEGLHAAHELRNDKGELRHLVHRDVTPSNILVGIHGEVKLIDFGVAKARDRLSHTSTGTIKGKFGYMSPEQARGFPMDRRSDVFALGVVLWETLALRRLYRSESELEILRMIVEEAPPSIRTVRSDAPDSLDPLLTGSLAKNRDDRLGSCAEFADYLWAIFHEQGYTAGEAEVAEFFQRVMPERFKAVSELLSGANEFIEPTVAHPITGSGSFSGRQNSVSGAVPRTMQASTPNGQAFGRTASVGNGVAYDGRPSGIAIPSGPGVVSIENTGSLAGPVPPATYTTTEPQKKSRGALMGAVMGGGIVALLGAGALMLLSHRAPAPTQASAAPMNTSTASAGGTTPLPNAGTNTVAAPSPQGSVPTAPTPDVRPQVNLVAPTTESQHTGTHVHGTHSHGGNSAPTTITQQQTENSMLVHQGSSHANSGATNTATTQPAHTDPPPAHTDPPPSHATDSQSGHPAASGGSSSQGGGNAGNGSNGHRGMGLVNTW